MGIGATIAINRVAMTDLSDQATEIRVQQYADRATTYSIRFEADICGGDFEIVDSPLLRPRNEANNMNGEYTQPPEALRQRLDRILQLIF